MGLFSVLVMYGLSAFYSCLVFTFLVVKSLFNPSKPFWYRKKRDKAPECLQDPALGTHHYAKLKGIQLHYVEKGDHSKPLMLFIHGFPEFWYSWRHQIKEFSKDYWVVAYDMRGYGDSEKPESVSSYSMDLLVDDVKQLVEYFGKQKITLVAHDWGGMVAWYFLLKHPEKVEKYIIMDTGFPKGFFNSLKQFFKSWYIFFFQMPYLPEMFASSFDLENFTKVFIDDGSVETGGITEEDIEAYKFTFQNKGGFTAPINYYRASMRKRTTNEPQPKRAEPRFDLPVGLFLFAENDRYLEGESLLKTAKTWIPNLKTQIVSGGNHFVQQSVPTQLNHVMREFLKSSS
ncbi:epoxide hydrolase 4-like [Schistocerca cancellata]|uniref:epoxide hydrolase 4-like n=1 Tax=Schistocerca cancellata TaxID=274614 RepID=UPI002118BB16|nr:epoxide hydrolase 4-like [Schistocerca cancellata]